MICVRVCVCVCFFFFANNQYSATNKPQLYKSHAILYFGAQRFRIVNSEEMNCLRLDIVGESGIAVLDKLVEQVQIAVTESLRMLKVSSWLRLPRSSALSPQQQPREREQEQEQEQEQEVVYFVNLKSALACIEKSQPMALADNKNRRVHGIAPELKLAELKALCAAFVVDLAILHAYDLFLSYRWSPFDKQVVDGLFTRCTLHNTGPPSFKVSMSSPASPFSPLQFN